MVRIFHNIAMPWIGVVSCVVSVINLFVLSQVNRKSVSITGVVQVVNDSEVMCLAIFVLEYTYNAQMTEGR